MKPGNTCTICECAFGSRQKKEEHERRWHAGKKKCEARLGDRVGRGNHVQEGMEEGEEESSINDNMYRRTSIFLLKHQMR